MELNDDGVNYLRVAIIQSAIEEYCDRIECGIETDSIDHFFDSKWFDILCEGFGKEIATKIRKYAKDGIKPKRSFVW